jgi:hypothetical protein
MPEEVIIRIKLRGSATLESPETIKQMVESQLDTMIPAWMRLFIAGHTIEVHQ